MTGYVRDINFKRKELLCNNPLELRMVDIAERLEAMIIKRNPSYAHIAAHEHIMLLAAKQKPVPVVYGVGVEFSMTEPDKDVDQWLHKLCDGLEKEMPSSVERPCLFQVSCGYIASLNVFMLKVNAFHSA